MYSLEKLSFCIKTEEKSIAQYIDLKKNVWVWEQGITKNMDAKIIFAFVLCLSNLHLFFSFFFSAILFLVFKFSKELYQRFNLSKIYYEESSWFDNKIWQKNIFLIKKDKIFSKQKIKRKLSLFYKIFFIFLINTILLFLLLSI
jgi:hypothetical protein